MKWENEPGCFHVVKENWEHEPGICQVVVNIFTGFRVIRKELIGHYIRSCFLGKIPA